MITQKEPTDIVRAFRERFCDYFEVEYSDPETEDKTPYEIEAFLIAQEKAIREECAGVVEEALEDIWSEPDTQDINSYASGNHHGIIEVKQAVREALSEIGR